MHRRRDKPGLTLLHEETTAGRFRWPATLLLIFALVLAGCARTATPAPPSSTLASVTPTPSPTPPPATSNVSNDVCLGCHGPYDKVVKATANYAIQDGSGSVVNPHTTVDMSAKKPHTTGKGVPQCTNCHKPHPQPLVSSKDVAKANVEYCFSCHHQRNFMLCSQCHNRP